MVLIRLPPTDHGSAVLGYERVYLPLYKVADTPLHIQGGDVIWSLPSHFCKF